MAYAEDIGASISAPLDLSNKISATLQQKSGIVHNVGSGAKYSDASALALEAPIDMTSRQEAVASNAKADGGSTASSSAALGGDASASAIAGNPWILAGAAALLGAGALVFLAMRGRRKAKKKGGK